MKHRLIFIVAVLMFSAAVHPSLAHAQKLVILVRHAERADAGMASKDKDPLLSPAGKARAAKLSNMLADAGIKAIYVTQYRRTQETAKPLASRLGIAAEPTPLTADSFVDRLKSAHANDVVFVVGHSDTIPALVKALVGVNITIADRDYDNMFFVVPATGTITRIHF